MDRWIVKVVLLCLSVFRFLLFGMVVDFMVVWVIMMVWVIFGIVSLVFKVVVVVVNVGILGVML